jgi:hypothetical protein
MDHAISADSSENYEPVTQATARGDVAHFMALAAIGATTVTALNLVTTRHSAKALKLARNVALAYTVGAGFCTGLASAMYVDTVRRDRQCWPKGTNPR